MNKDMIILINDITRLTEPLLEGAKCRYHSPNMNSTWLEVSDEVLIMLKLKGIELLDQKTLGGFQQYLIQGEFAMERDLTYTMALKAARSITTRSQK